MPPRVSPPAPVAHGLAVGLDTLTGLNFDPHYPYAGCKLCGAVYQSRADRNPVGLLAAQRSTAQRKAWSQSHAKTHSDQEHLSLAKSGQWCTPEAAHKLAAFGTIPLNGNAEITAALAASSSIPTNDCEA